MTRKIVVLFGLLSILLLAGVSQFSRGPCAPAPVQEAERGSHGYRLWLGSDLQSFEHRGERICIPDGWEAIGAQRVIDSWAQFPEGTTGVLIQTERFQTKEFAFEHSSYRVTLLYPVATSESELQEYEHIVRNAFERVGALYPDARLARHTVIVTAGLGLSESEHDSIYPDPGPDVSYLALHPSQSRSEELFIHAIAHLHNRHRPDLTAYTLHQAPLSSGDFQELEASWTETAFEKSDDLRAARLAYLMNIHAAVMENDFSRIEEPPFDNHSDFLMIRPSAISTTSWTYLDDQYGYYVLAPLALTAIDTLLAPHNVSVAELLTEIHKTRENFFARLREILSANDVARVERWLRGEERIPEHLIQEAVDQYSLP